MKPKILLVVARNNHRWEEIVRKAVVRVGKSLDVITDSELNSISAWDDYALVIVDASFIEDLVETLANIRSYSTNTGIVVFSPAPQWKEAKDVILAGASDYELRPSREQGIYFTLKHNLAKLPFQQGDKLGREIS